MKRREDQKAKLTEAQRPRVTCPKGHTYRVPLRFYWENVGKMRDFVCPMCHTTFRARPSGMDRSTGVG